MYPRINFVPRDDLRCPVAKKFRPAPLSHGTSSKVGVAGGAEPPWRRKYHGTQAAPTLLVSCSAPTWRIDFLSSNSSATFSRNDQVTRPIPKRCIRDMHASNADFHARRGGTTAYRIYPWSFKYSADGLARSEFDAVNCPSAQLNDKLYESEQNIKVPYKHFTKGETPKARKGGKKLPHASIVCTYIQLSPTGRHFRDFGR